MISKEQNDRFDSILLPISIGSIRTDPPFDSSPLLQNVYSAPSKSEAIEINVGRKLEPA